METTPNSIFNPNVQLDLDLDALPAGKISRVWVKLASNGLGWPLAVPVMVAKGVEPGPVVGLSAAVHGNELNGIPVIHRFFKELDPTKLKGTVVGVLVVNIPGFLAKKRRFPDGVDPNHIMPGDPNGNASSIYFNRFIERIVNRFDYLVDLHTASFGRINSYYIRVDMSTEKTKQMALMQNADIIIHNPPHDGTLRGAADDMGIAAITLEVGDPNLFQKGMIRSGMTGIHNLLISLGMTEGEIEKADEKVEICRSSIWIYTQQGGLLTVFPQVTQWVEEGERIAEVRNIFGDLVETYHAPQRGIVIGKSVSPVNQSGGRILHLGIP